MISPDIDDLGIELQDRFGKRHWVPLRVVLQYMLQVANLMIEDETSKS